MQQAMECTGVVKRWNEEKGYGFLIPSGGGDDVWVHRSELAEEGRADLYPGDKVSFFLVDDGKGRGKFKALSVTVTEANTGRGIFQDLFPRTNHEFNAQGSLPKIGLEHVFEVSKEPVDSGAASLFRDFVIYSSMRCPFIVLSEGQLVNSVRVPEPEELELMLRVLHEYITGCEARNAAVLADFEGEMPGIGGELSTAQIQLTEAVDSSSLVPRRQPKYELFSTAGIMIDLRYERCIQVLRRIMESSAITKLMWGADGDCQCLMYQVVPMPLRIAPRMVVDVQVAFTTGFRMGMARMLREVPPEYLEGLPTKEQIDWDSFHCQNRRALPLPLEPLAATYAIDDLHRIEAILATKAPPTGSYAGARRITTEMLQQFREDPCGIQALQEEIGWFERKQGVKRTVQAVQLARHIHAIRFQEAAPNGVEQEIIDRAEACAMEELYRAGVVVASDLSFNG